MKILMVLTSHDKLGNTGRKTGFWLEELAAPYFTFLDAGATVTLASPRGGQPPLDPVVVRPQNETTGTRCLWYNPHDHRRAFDPPPSAPGIGGIGAILSSWQAVSARNSEGPRFSESAILRMTPILPDSPRG